MGINADIEMHYGGSLDLATRIRNALIAAGRKIEHLTPADLASVDEFHIRGRPATLELAERMELTPQSHVLDIGSGMGGPARTLVETHGCTVTGIDLTQGFCTAATAISEWLGLSDKVNFVQGDATDPPFAPDSFDAAMTIHAAMNIRDKGALYAGARRVLKPGAIFAAYDVVEGDGGAVHFPMPWAREASLSHLVTPREMRRLLADAGFQVLDEIDSSEESLAWFRAMAERMTKGEKPPVTFRIFLGEDFPQMALNQIANLAERRIRTVAFICRA